MTKFILTHDSPIKSNNEKKLVRIQVSIILTDAQLSQSIDKHWHIDMLLFKYYKIFLHIFFVIGVAPLCTESELAATHRRTKQRIVQLFLCRLVPIINLIISLSQFSLLLKIVDGTLDGKVQVILFYGYFTLTILTNIVGNVQCFFFRSEYFDITRQVHHIEQLFRVKFSKQIDLQRSYNIFQLKILILFSMLICATLTSFLFNGWVFSHTTMLRMVVTILETICTLGTLQPMLYVSLIRIFVQEMNVTLKSTKKIFRMADAIFEKCEALEKLKLIHFEVYNLVNKINLYFGWNLLFFMLKYFVDITYNLYWIFIEIQELGWDSTTHIGKLKL